MVYCCCTWKLLMSLKYTHYHANPPYFFLGGTSDSVSAYIHLVVFAQLLVSRLLLLVQGQVSLYQYSCLWKCMGYCWNMGSLTNTHLPLMPFPLLDLEVCLLFFHLDIFFSPPPSIYWCGRGQLCKPVMHGSHLQSEKNSSKHVCVHLIEWMLPPQRGSPTTTFLQWSWLSV